MMDNTLLEISPAELKDIPELRVLLRELFSQEKEFEPDGNAQARGLEAIIGGAEVGVVLVARDETGIMGMVNLLYTISTALGGRVAVLEDMITAPRCRGRGVGSQLLTFALEYARTQGCRRVTLLTDHDNHDAHRFYETHGFARSSMAVFRMPLEQGT